MTPGNVIPLVFSDLDGSLLDHYSYSFREALPTVQLLERMGIPLILVSSKTRSEILELRMALSNSHPFIVENGAAVFIPSGYFSQQPANTRVAGDYWVHDMASPRGHWLEALAQLQDDFGPEFQSFSNAGVRGIMEMTGLSEAQANAANNRDYSEPVSWLGCPERESLFIKRLSEAGATVTRGGRFLSVSDNCDKGSALIWLREQFCVAHASPAIEDLAIGDGENDRTMMAAARTALLIRSPEHDFPLLDKTGNVIHSNKFGPTGWAEGVTQWLNLNDFKLQG